MMTAKATRIATLAAMTLALALPAMAAVTSRADNLAHPRGWSAMEGMTPGAVARMAQTLPLSAQATGDQPWCDHQTAMAQALADEFGERKVATGAQGIALWGSDRMGTWTMVLERADATSCVIASGVGYSDRTSPQVFFGTSGLNG